MICRGSDVRLGKLSYSHVWRSLAHLPQVGSARSHRVLLYLQTVQLGRGLLLGSSTCNLGANNLALEDMVVGSRCGYVVLERETDEALRM
jgi:hypothetical protein